MSAAKVQIGKSVRFVGQQSVQLHGGVGVTYALSVGHYFKRNTMIDMMYGDADHHLDEAVEHGRSDRGVGARPLPNPPPLTQERERTRGFIRHRLPSVLQSPLPRRGEGRSRRLPEGFP